MKSDLIQQSFDVMRDREEGGLSVLLQQVIRDTLVGRSLEALMPLLEVAHDRLVAQPEMAAALMDGGRVSATAMPEGRFGGVWRKGLVFETDRGTTLVTLHLLGEPDPEGERAMAKARGIPYKPTMTGEPGEAFKIQVYHLRASDELWSVLNADAADRWNSNLSLNMERSERLPSGRWSASVRGGVVGSGMAIWPVFFADLRKLVDALGLQTELTAAQEAMRLREWEIAESDRPRFRAARDLAMAAALADGYLPGTVAQTMLRNVEHLMTADAMRFIMPSAMLLSDLIERGQATACRCHEGRNAVQLLSDEHGGFLFMESMEGIDFTLRPTSTGVALIATQGGNLAIDPRLCLALEFQELEGGGWLQTGDIGQDAEAIRAWNAFHDGMLSIGRAAAEEVGLPMPSPTATVASPSVH